MTCDGGVKRHSRACDNPPPQYGGADCFGETLTDPEECNTHVCEPEWSAWGSWTVCDVTCGIGTQSGNRTCLNLERAPPNASCPGHSKTTQECIPRPCPGNVQVIISLMGAHLYWDDVRP